MKRLAAMKSRKKSTPSRGKSRKRADRRWARVSALVLFVGFAIVNIIGNIYVHHPASWLEEHRNFFTMPLEYFGNRSAFITDALGWTGRDAVNTPDDPVPEGQVCFAGEPVRVGAPAPDDIRVLDRGEFKVGWSPSLKHPVWVAYHVPRDATHDMGKRPNFTRDKEVASSPSPQEYAGSGYDRGHMVPNRAIVTRFGPDMQRNTFRMTNIAPQRPALNRGPWRELEQRIADLWTAKYGEIWVIVGAVPPQHKRNRHTLPNTSIQVPEKFYMIIASQTADSVRVLAVMLDQEAGRWDFPVHNIVSVDEIESLTGLDFFPDMQKSLQNSLESDVPTRLWPIRTIDVVKLILMRFV